MPQKEIDLAMWFFAGGRKLKCYEGRFTYNDRLTLTRLCGQLGYLEDMAYSDYADPLEVLT